MLVRGAAGRPAPDGPPDAGIWSLLINIGYHSRPWQNRVWRLILLMLSRWRSVRMRTSPKRPTAPTQSRGLRPAAPPSGISVDVKKAGHESDLIETDMQ